MAEHVAVIEELQKLPEGIHIFCPRLSDDRAEDPQDDNTGREAESKERREKFFSALPLLAYDGAECHIFHQWLYNTLDNQLVKCDSCIRQYYLGKNDFKAKLLEDYDDGEVEQFLSIISRKDTSRIKSGLQAVTRKLEPLPKEQRTPKVLDNKQLFAFYEALHCDAFYNDEGLLESHFDSPFNLVQTNKELKIKEILPAITKFLFSSNQFRLSWAVKMWQRLGRHPTNEEWDWAVKDILRKELDAIRSENGLVRYWGALAIICNAMSDEQVKLKLYDLGFNFPRLSLDHLAKPTNAIQEIARCLSIVWTKAPDDYWSTLTSVSAGTVAEQFFASPNFDKCLEAQVGEQKGRYDVLAWMEPFLKGLQSASRPPAARTLAHQLFSRIKAPQMSEEVRQLCFVWVVKVLLDTVMTFSEDEQARAAAARPVLSDTLTLVGTYLPAILSFDIKGADEQATNAIRSKVCDLVRNSLGLECQMLRADYDSLRDSRPKAQSSSHTPDLWRTVNRHMNADRNDLSMALLASTRDLAGLEKFPIKSDTAFKGEKESFNSMFTKVEDLLSQCIDHLAEFPAEHLDPLFGNQATNMALIALLFSGNDSIYQATVELIKNIAQEPGRVEALSHVIEAFFANTLYSICWVFRRIGNYMPFSPVPRLLKTGKDIMDLLCDTAGLLRSKKLELRERESVASYWAYSWGMLTTIFRRMEKWSLDVGDKPLMTEVCRNTMQYAQELFSHYYLFVKVVEQGAKSGEASKTAKLLLNTEASSSTASPPKALDSMVKWLRLKDPYLAETLVNLIVVMLRRLKEYGTQIPRDGYALTFVEEVSAGTGVKGKGTRTILNDNQKAGLIRSLEQYTGKQIAKQLQTRSKKQQRLDAWTDSNIREETKAKREIIAIDDDDVKDEDLQDLDKANILRTQALLDERKTQKFDKRLQESRKSSVSSKLIPRPTPGSLGTKPSASAQAFLAKRKEEEAAKKARNAELVARLRGQTGSAHTANAGSGLSGLGVQGKDHSMARSDLMVSSESENESSEDDELFGTSAKAGKALGGMRDLNNLASMPTKVKKVTRSAKDMRARLSPDLTGLHKTILAWDFFADTETPPKSDRDDYTLVTNTFKTVEDYQKTFEPLLILEGWQSFRTAREDGTFKPFEVKVANSMIVDNFFEVNSTISIAEGRDLGITPSDVVLLSKGSRPHVEPNEPHCLARVKEITRKRGEMQIVYRVNSSNNPMRNYLNDKSTVHAVQILSLTPLEREYGALMALPYYDLLEEVIRAKPSPLLEYTDEEVREIQELHTLNVAQAKAVKSAVDNDAFTLIQGPPGSGKTKTITAILSAILTGSARLSGSHRMNSSSGPPTFSKKVLVAAPSNAAVDELVMRFKDGIKVSGGTTQKINVVRLGRSEAIDAAVKDVTLEELTNAKLSESTGTNSNSREDIHSVMMEHKKASDEMVQLKQKMDETRQKGQQVSSSDDQLHEALRRRKITLSANIDAMREKQNSATRDADINRRRIQQEILDSAHVLCATLSGSGHEIFQGLNVEFETVIIDEAAQSIELSALIPLKYGCSKCILVGDPKQLPPTVLSRHAAKYQYEQSLFARMENNHKKDVHLLDTQYRMHPEISAFPSRTFYESKLRDGGDMARSRARPWHRSQIFSPYRFFDVEGMSQSAPKGRSLVNEAEIEVALAMYDRLVSDVPKYNFKNKIGIITPYKGQLRVLKQRFSMRYGEGILNVIDFNTTDAFQGRESEIIIFSCVRASTKGIGFLNDVRRMNVGLTRAKCSLWVLGNSQALVQGEFWRALVNDAKERSLYTDDDILKVLRKPLLTADMMKDDVEMSGMDDEPSNATSPVRHTAGDRVNSDSPSSLRFANPASNAPHKPSRKPSAPPATDESLLRTTIPSPDPMGVGTRSKPQSLTSSARSTPIVESRPDAPSRKTREPPVTAYKPDSVKPETAMEAQIVRQAAAEYLPTAKGVHGPSGGRFGLNSKINCTICGSDQHFSHNCNNDKAREHSLGTCGRCSKVGHTRSSCEASRCLTCGEVGHVESACTADSSRRLSPSQRQEVEKQEAEHLRNKQRHKEKLARKQLGEHSVSIPTVKTVADSDVKRKRSTDEEGALAKLPKIGPGDRPIPIGPAAIRTTGAMAPKGPQLIRKKPRDEGSLFAKKR